jgi:hypothetical protein
MLFSNNSFECFAIKKLVNSYENSQDAPVLTNGLRKCGVHTQWNCTQPQRMKFCHMQVNGWNWKTSS